MSVAQDYFPIVLNAKYSYQGTDVEKRSYTILTDYANDSKQQLRINNHHTERVDVYQYDSTGVKLVFSYIESHIRENFLNEIPNENFYILLNPIAIGTTWPARYGGTSTITNIGVSVETPYSNFTSALEVTTINREDRTVDYYVKNIGLVKSILYHPSRIPVYSALKEIKYNIPFTQEIRFFYPDNAANKIWYVDKNINFFTNDSNELKFGDEFKNFHSCFLPCIGPNTTINSLYYNKFDPMVHVDFSSNFVNDLNASSKHEALSLLSITNTIGKYYYKNEVYITLDGNPYSSSNIQKQPGEPFLTNFNDINECANYPCKTEFYYTVKEDDTLSEIAYSFGATYQELAEINNIPDPDLIYVGQVLLVYFDGIYIVRSGDTLSEIAQIFGTTYQELTRINNIPNPDLIYPEQVLRIY
jgi:hypothetical protein